MADENKIVIVGEYVDLASPKIKEAFQKQEKSVRDFSAEFDKMRKSLMRNANANRKAVVDSMKGMQDSMKKTREETKRTRTEMGQMRLITVGIQRWFGQIRNAILLYVFAMRLVQRIIGDNIAAYEKQQLAIVRLNAALSAQGTMLAHVSERLREQAAAMQLATGYGDEMILEVMQKLISIGGVVPSQLDKVTQAVLDFSTATGRDLGAASQIMAKAAAGYTGELSRYGIIIDKNLPKTERFAAVMKFMNERFGGAAQADMKSYAGQMKGLKSSFSDLREDLGYITVYTLRLGQGIKWLAEHIRALRKVTSGPQKTDSETEMIDNQIQRLQKLESYLKGTKWQDLWQYLIPAWGQGKAIDDVIQERNLKAEFNIDAKGAEAALAQVQAKIEDLRLAARGAMKAQIDSAPELRAKEVFNEMIVNFDNARATLTEKMNALQTTQIQSQARELKEEYALYQKHFKDKIGLYKEDQEEYLILLQERADFEVLYAKEAMALSKKMWEAKAAEGEWWGSMVASSANGAAKAMEDGFFSIIHGRFEDLSDVVVEFGNTVLRTFLRLASEKAVWSIWSIFSGGAKTSATSSALSSSGNLFSSPSLVGAVARKGGYIRSGMNSSYGPPIHFNQGGEVPAVLHAGEGVLNKRAMSNLGVNNLDKLNRGEGAGGGQTVNNYYIQTIDERSFRERLSQNGDIFSNAANRDISDNRGLRKTIQRYG